MQLEDKYCFWSMPFSAWGIIQLLRTLIVLKCLKKFLMEFRGWFGNRVKLFSAFAASYLGLFGLDLLGESKEDKSCWIFIASSRSRSEGDCKHMTQKLIGGEEQRNQFWVFDIKFEFFFFHDVVKKKSLFVASLSKSSQLLLRKGKNAIITPSKF